MKKRMSNSAIVSFLFALVLLLYSAGPASGYETYWQHDPATPGDWHNPANWDNGVPTISDDAFIDNDGTAQIFADAKSRYLYAGNYNSGAIEQFDGINTIDDYLYLGEKSGSSGTYSLSGGKLSVGSTEYIGYDDGTGEFTQTGGTHTINWDLCLGQESGSDGTYNLSGGELSAGGEYIGLRGAGEFIQTGGTNTVSEYLYLGRSLGSSGTYNLSGNGVLSASELCIGYHYQDMFGAGEFNQSGGTNSTGYLYVAEGSSYTLGNGTLSIGNSANIEGSFHFDNNAWILNIDGGLANFTNATIDGAGSASFTSAANTLTIFPEDFDPVAEFGSYIPSGMIHIAGSTLIISAGEGFTGRGWIGDLVQNRGTIVTSGDLDFRGGGLTISYGGIVNSGSYDLRFDNGATGTIESSGGTILAKHESIGFRGMGEFIQNGGTHTVNHFLYLGASSGSSGTYTLSAGELSASGEEIGFHGTGQFNQDGGTNTVGSLRLGRFSGSSGTYNLSGGGLSVISESIGYAGTGVFNQTGGTNTVSYQLYLGSAFGSSGTYRLSGSGVLQVDTRLRIGTISSGYGRFEWFGGTLNTPDITLFGRGTLALGYDINIADLVSGSLFGGTLSGLDLAELEITNGCTITHNSDAVAARFMRIGTATGSGVYNLQAGELIVGESIIIGENGVFNDDSATGGGGWIFVGDDFINNSESPELFSLTHSTLKMWGGAVEEFPAILDMNSLDLGDDCAGLVDNFALGTLIFEGASVSTPFYYRLESDVYTHGLVLNEGAELDLNGYTLYYLPFGQSYCGIATTTQCFDGTWYGGDIVPLTGGTLIPEPGTIAMLAAGALGMAGIIRRRFK